MDMNELFEKCIKLGLINKSKKNKKGGYTKKILQNLLRSKENQNKGKGKGKKKKKKGKKKQKGGGETKGCVDNVNVNVYKLSPDIVLYQIFPYMKLYISFIYELGINDEEKMINKVYLERNKDEFQGDDEVEKKELTKRKYIKMLYGYFKYYNRNICLIVQKINMKIEIKRSSGICLDDFIPFNKGLDGLTIKTDLKKCQLIEDNNEFVFMCSHLKLFHENIGVWDEGSRVFVLAGGRSKSGSPISDQEFLMNFLKRFQRLKGLKLWNVVVKMTDEYLKLIKNVKDLSLCINIDLDEGIMGCNNTKWPPVFKELQSIELLTHVNRSTRYIKNDKKTVMFSQQFGELLKVNYEKLERIKVNLFYFDLINLTKMKNINVIKVSKPSQKSLQQIVISSVRYLTIYNMQKWDYQRTESSPINYTIQRIKLNQSDTIQDLIDSCDNLNELVLKECRVSKCPLLYKVRKVVLINTYLGDSASFEESGVKELIIIGGNFFSLFFTKIPRLRTLHFSFTNVYNRNYKPITSKREEFKRFILKCKKLREISISSREKLDENLILSIKKSKKVTNIVVDQDYTTTFFFKACTCMIQNHRTKK